MPGGIVSGWVFVRMPGASRRAQESGTAIGDQTSCKYTRSAKACWQGGYYETGTRGRKDDERFRVITQFIENYPEATYLSA